MQNNGVKTLPNPKEESGFLSVPFVCSSSCVLMSGWGTLAVIQTIKNSFLWSCWEAAFDLSFGSRI